MAKRLHEALHPPTTSVHQLSSGILESPAVSAHQSLSGTLASTLSTQATIQATTQSGQQIASKSLTMQAGQKLAQQFYQFLSSHQDMSMVSQLITPVLSVSVPFVSLPISSTHL